MRLCHPDASPIPQEKKGCKVKGGQRTYKGQQQCSLCCAVTIRVDVHLKAVHKMVRGTPEFEKALGEATMFVRTANTDLQRALLDYG